MSMTISAAINLLDEDNRRKMLSPETLIYYRGNLSRFTDWLTVHRVTKTKQLNNDVVDEYTLFLVQTVENKTSINTYLRAIRRFVNFLGERKEIKPFKVLQLKDFYKIKPTFDDLEVERILDSVSPRDDTSIIMLLLLSTGMRSRTLCELRVRDVHFNEGYIDLKQTKSGIPLCPPLTAEVMKCLQHYILFYNRSANDYLFQSINGEMFNRYSLVQRINKRLARLGIDKTGVHTFRHTFGKIMSMNNCPTAVLQKWLGHTDIKTTQKYTNLYCNDLRKTLNILPTSDFQFT